MPKPSRVTIEPFTIDVPEATLADLHERLTRVRWPRELDGRGRCSSSAPRGRRRAYADLRRFTEMPRGGHFAAMEEPELLVEDIRASFRDLRSRVHGDKRPG